MSNRPNYQNYTNSELVEAFESIDQGLFPERFQELILLMKEKGLILVKGSNYELTDIALTSDSEITLVEGNVPTYTCNPPEPKYDENGIYIPNEIPLKNRLSNILISSAIISYGGYGLYIDELWVPIAKRVSVVLSGISAVVMFIAIVSASLMMLVEVVDHYDRRDNEHKYYKLAVYSKNTSYIGFGFAVLIGLFMGARLE